MLEVGYQFAEKGSTGSGSYLLFTPKCLVLSRYSNPRVRYPLKGMAI